MPWGHDSASTWKKGPPNESRPFPRDGPSRPVKTQRSQVSLLNAKHFPRDNELLNLTGAVKNAKGPRVTKEPFHNSPFLYAEASKHLQCLIDDVGCGLA